LWLDAKQRHFLEFGGDFLETVAEMLASLCG